MFMLRDRLYILAKTQALSRLYVRFFLRIYTYNIKNNRLQFMMGISRLVEKENSKLLIHKIIYQLIFNTFDQDLELMSYM